MRAVFFIYGFTPHNLRLQPWLTIAEVGRLLTARGHHIEVVTDTETESLVGGLPVRRVTSLRKNASTEIMQLLDEIRPDVAITTITPLNLATTSWFGYGMNVRWLAFASWPFYKRRELLRALPHIPLRALFPYVRHLFVPHLTWTHRLRGRFQGVICQSVRTADRITDLVRGCVPVHAIAPGLDLGQWNCGTTQPSFAATPRNGKIRFLYLGAASHIRGFYVLLRAMQQLVRDEPGINAELIVLARGADSEHTRAIETEVAARGISSVVRIIGGWLDRAELLRHIGEATAVVLPFVLVPSELPVTAMEVIACGTPVIATDVDGLPDTVGKAGTIVPAGNAKALAKAMQGMAHNPAVPAGWRQAAHEQTARMESWDAIAARWLEVFKSA